MPTHPPLSPPFAPTLAQFSPGGGADSVPRLPAPPSWEVWLFESPWTPAVALLVIGVTAFWLLNRAGQLRNGLLALAAAAGLAGIVILTASLVTTQREAMIESTRALIRTTAAGMGAPIAKPEDGTLTDHVADDIVLMFGGQDRIVGRDPLVAAVGTGARFVGLKLERVILLEAAAQATDRNAGFTQVWVRAEGSFPLSRSWWRIGWRRESDPADPKGYRWRATSIDCLQLDGLTSPRDVPGFGS